MAGKQVRVDAESLEQFDDLANLVKDSFEMLGRAAKHLHSLLLDDSTRAMLIEHRRDDAGRHLAEFCRAAAAGEEIKHLLQFFSSPSRRTLRAAIDDGSLDDGHVRDVVNDFDQEIEWRCAEFPANDAETDQMRANAELRRRAVASVRHEDTDETPSEIAAGLGMSRSQVYEAVNWFRSLSDELQMSLRTAVWGVPGNPSQPGKLCSTKSLEK